MMISNNHNESNNIFTNISIECKCDLSQCGKPKDPKIKQPYLIFWKWIEFAASQLDILYCGTLPSWNNTEHDLLPLGWTFEV